MLRWRNSTIQATVDWIRAATASTSSISGSASQTRISRAGRPAASGGPLRSPLLPPSLCLRCSRGRISHQIASGVGDAVCSQKGIDVAEIVVVATERVRDPGARQRVEQNRAMACQPRIAAPARRVRSWQGRGCGGSRYRIAFITSMTRLRSPRLTRTVMPKASSRRATNLGVLNQRAGSGGDSSSCTRSQRLKGWAPAAINLRPCEAASSRIERRRRNSFAAHRASHPGRRSVPTTGTTNARSEAREWTLRSPRGASAPARWRSRATRGLSGSTNWYSSSILMLNDGWAVVGHGSLSVSHRSAGRHSIK